MPSSSVETTPNVVNLLGVERRYWQLEGHTVSHEVFRHETDTATMFRGLPGDSCQSPHWGVVQRGRVTFRYEEHEETVTAGQAYHARPGHTALIEAGTELVQFSPSEALAAAREVSVHNLAAALTDPEATGAGRAA